MHEIRKRGGTSGMGTFLAFLVFIKYVTLRCDLYNPYARFFINYQKR